MTAVLLFIESLKCVLLLRWLRLILWEVILCFCVAIWVSCLIVVHDVVGVIVIHVYYVHLVDVVSPGVFIRDWFLLRILISIKWLFIAAIFMLRIFSLTFMGAKILLVHVRRDWIALCRFILLITDAHSAYRMGRLKFLLLLATPIAFFLLPRRGMDRLRSWIFLDDTEQQFIRSHCQISFDTLLKLSLAFRSSFRFLLCQPRLRLPRYRLKLLNVYARFIQIYIEINISAQIILVYAFRRVV